MPVFDPPHQILLPLSLGPSSLALLDVLHEQLNSQRERIGQVGYELTVLYVDEGWGEHDRTQRSLVKLQEHYPQHTYLSKGIEEAISLLLEQKNSEPGNLFKSLRLATELSSVPSEQFNNLLQSLPSSTSRSDVLQILRQRLITSTARGSGCTVVLWGDSTTKLAERTLAEAGKGRGFALPWQTGTGLTQDGVTFLYPMRDLLRKEIQTFVKTVTPHLLQFVVENPTTAPLASSKENTIDVLMRQYFESVEENYPSIVANVVRTTSKLQPISDHDLAQCALCSMPLEMVKNGQSAWGGDQCQRGNIEISKTHDTSMCYGCRRALID
jgi:cytoplasmic tRNA 2-thiolation protein 2